MAQPMPQAGTSRTGSDGFQPSPFLGKMKGIMNMMRSGGNSDAMLQSMIQNNPQYGAIMELVKQYNGDARAAFYDLAKQKGVDPNEILNMLK